MEQFRVPAFFVGATVLVTLLYAAAYAAKRREDGDA